MAASLTFAATANVVVHLGARPVLVDVEPETGNIDPAAIEPAIGACAELLGGLDIVVANAGVAHRAAIGRGSLAQLQETITVDLLGACATIDAAVRLNRYLLEELWASIFRRPPALLRSYFFNSFLCVGTMFLLGYTNAFLSIWPIFGSANQLLAALTLMGIAVWLYRKGKQYLFLIYPALFMMVTALLALVYLLLKVYGPEGNVTLIAVDLILIGLALGVLFLTLKTFLSKPVPAPITTSPNRPT